MGYLSLSGASLEQYPSHITGVSYMYWYFFFLNGWVCILEVFGMIPVQYVLDTGTWAKMEYPCILANTCNHQRWEGATNNYKNKYTVRWFSVEELNFEFNLEKINSRRRRRRRNILTIIWVLAEVGLLSSCKNKVEGKFMGSRATNCMCIYL